MISFVSGEAEHVPSHLPPGTKNSDPTKSAKAVWNESDKI
jgi:hypothetical protein